MLARMAMIAITTSNSIRVNAEENVFVLFIFICICWEGRDKSQFLQIKSILIFLTFLAQETTAYAGWGRAGSLGQP